MAAGGNIDIKAYSIGGKLSKEKIIDVLVSGKDIRVVNFRAWHGNVRAKGLIDNSDHSIENQLNASAVIESYSYKLDVDFDQEFSELKT